MSRAFYALCLCFCMALFFSGAAVARDEGPLAIDLADEHVRITTGFTGDSLVVFGDKTERGDVVVILEGPEYKTTVRRKSRVLGAWINTAHVSFKNIPSYYDYALSVEDETGILPRESLHERHLGLKGWMFEPEKTGQDEDEVKVFRAALLRDKQKRGLFPRAHQDVDFISDNLFRVDFKLPANVPSGRYTVRAFLIRDHQIIHEQAHPLHVGLEGFSSDVYEFAQERGASYGMLCVLVALLAGWLSNVIVRRS